MPKKKEFNYSRDDLDRLIVDIFNGTVSPERLPVDLYNATFDRLLDGVFRGFGNTLDELNDGTPEKLLLEYYQHNIAIFSGAKTFQQVNDMSNAVFTPDGYKRSFSDFKKLITGDNFHNGIFAQYNVNYLQTEYNTAVRVAQMGRQFTEYYKDADLFPYLKYITVHDERVRDTHKYFDGVTLPVGHKFWDTHCPPNGFNCRCRVIQLSEFDDFTITPDADVKNLPDPDQPLFGMNPAKSGFVFDPSKHPYTVKIGERFAPASKVNFGLPTPPAPTIPITIPEPPKVKTKDIPKSIPSNLRQIMDTDTDPEFWLFLDESETPFVRKAQKVRKGKKMVSEGSYASGDGKLVVLDTERYTTDAGKKKIIYHEFGHIIHKARKYCARSGIRDHVIDIDVEQTFDKWAKEFKGSNFENFAYKPENFDFQSVGIHLDHKFMEHWNWKRAIQKEFPGMDKDDFDEHFGATMDTVNALTRGRLGWGHELKYWKRDYKYSQVAEFMAHAFENRFAGNVVFKKMYPDLYSDMVKLMDKLIEKRKNELR